MSFGDSPKNDETKGFGGLAGMVSDVRVSEMERETSPGTSAKPHSALPAAQGAGAQRAGAVPPQPRPYQEPTQPAQGSPGRKWLWGIGAVAVAALLWTQSADDKEVMPEPGGMNRKLSSSEIRYCVSEDIRIGAAKSVVNAYVEWEVDRFNQMVSDYNARCGRYQYSSGTLERVRSSVEKGRAALEAEGRARIQ